MILIASDNGVLMPTEVMTSSNTPFSRFAGINMGLDEHNKERRWM